MVTENIGWSLIFIGWLDPICKKNIGWLLSYWVVTMILGGYNVGWSSHIGWLKRWVVTMIFNSHHFRSLFLENLKVEVLMLNFRWSAPKQLGMCN